MTPRALSIAGSDPTGGAGIQQDLAVFGAHGVWGLSAVTAVTAQDTTAVRRWTPLAPEVVRAQIDAVMADIGADAAKSGVLGDAGVVVEVARAVTDHGIELLVVDPVMRATSGDDLVTADAIEALRAELVPRAALVTPNAPEAQVLTGIEVLSRADQARAARALVATGARAALVKGGHLPGPQAVDVLVVGDATYEMSAERIDVEQVHGTGCVLSAAIVAHLARGSALPDAVRAAKAFLTGVLGRANKLGAGALLLDVREAAARREPETR